MSDIHDYADKCEQRIAELQAENERLANEIINLAVEHPCYQLSKQLEAENIELTQALKDCVAALEFYGHEAVKPRDHWETEFLWDDDLGLSAREALAKHRELIEKY